MYKCNQCIKPGIVIAICQKSAGLEDFSILKNFHSRVTNVNNI